MSFTKPNDGVEGIEPKQVPTAGSIEETRFSILDTLKSLRNKCVKKIKTELQDLFKDNSLEQVEPIDFLKNQKDSLNPKVEAWLENYMWDPKNR